MMHMPLNLIIQAAAAAVTVTVATTVFNLYRIIHLLAWIIILDKEAHLFYQLVIVLIVANTILLETIIILY